MKQFVRAFLDGEDGQDLIEYTLLIAFVALGSAALFLGSGRSVKTIWNVSNEDLAKAARQFRREDN